MAKRRKVHKGTSSWKRDVFLLTCILRLRCSPPTPYSEIAHIIQQYWPQHAQKLAAKISPETELVAYLESSYEYAEENGNEVWAEARDWKTERVDATLRVVGLAGKGYSVLEGEELELQIKWRREGDWRAGSTPILFEDVQSKRRWHVWIFTDGLGGPETKMETCEKSFQEQFEEIRAGEEALKEEEEEGKERGEEKSYGDRLAVERGD